MKILYPLSLLALCLVLSIPLAAQLSQPTPPKSDVMSGLTTDLDTRKMPAVNVERATIEDKENDLMANTPWRFALPIEVDLNLQNAGTWEDLPDGGRLWRLQITSPGAVSLNFLYKDFYLPKDATLHLYTPGKKQIRGAFTHLNNKKDRKMATALTRGQTAILEYYEPQHRLGQGRLAIGVVNHGYRGYGESNSHTGDSGSCQVDINCSEGNAWQTIKKSVAKYTLNGGAWCSGALINNSAQDCRPLFLTADHCASPIPLDAVDNPTTGSTLVFYWNFERTGCNDGSNGDDSQTTTGASILANPDISTFSESSDFALFLLDESPYPVYDVYFAGFNATGAIGTGSVGIHHPSGDVKKIATDGDSPTSVVSDRYWRIFWDQTANGWSVTEGGSSGSPLFNANGEIIGQLFGTFAGSNPNCSDPANDNGDYGKLSYSWTNNGVTDSRRRLFDHLDPVGGGTNLIVAGSANPCSVSNNLCGGAISLSCNSSIKGSTVGSDNTDAPPQCIGSVFPGDGVWFTIVGDGSSVTINTDSPDTDYDTGLTVYTSAGGCSGPFTCVTANDDGPDMGFNSEVNFATQAGTTYYIYLDGFGNAVGSYGINVNCCDVPVASCKNHTVQLDASGQASIVAADVDNGSTADCGLASITVSPSSFDCSNLGANTVTLTITDNQGNVSSCTATVTVEDAEAPMITTCEGGTIVFNGEDSFNAEDYINLVVTDNCSTPTITYDPEVITCDQAGTTVSVTITATDASGNPSSCMADIEVDGLPCGWMDTGGIGCTGGSDYDGLSGDFTVTSTGCVPAYPYVSDQNGFIYQELCGDGSITALITGVTPGGGYPGNFAGVMMRETADPGSKLVAMGHNGNTFGQRRYRALDNYPSFPQYFYNLDKFWVKIERIGNLFRGYISADGQNWYPYLGQSIQMGNCIQAGLYADGANNTATFSNVMVEPLASQPLSEMPDLTDELQETNRGNLAPLNGTVAVYPNPTSGVLTVELMQFKDQDVQLSVLNANGKEQRAFDLGRVDYAMERVDLSDLPTGIYFLRIQATDQSPVTKRIVVQRP